MDYLPLRVYSVFSKGEGAVEPAAFADLLQQRGLPFLPVCDPLSLIGWDRFKREADKRQMRPMLGCEIRLPEKGSLLLFPASPAGYFSLIRSLNGRKVLPLEGVLAVFLPAVQDPRLLQKLRKKIGTENFHLGLEWKSPRWVVEWARQRQIPLVWAQPLRWTGDAGKYRSAAVVFRHLPLEEAARADVRLDGWIPATAVVRRWGEAGREALRQTLALAARIAFPFERIEGAAGGGDEPLERMIMKTLSARQTPKEQGFREMQRAVHELRIVRELGFSGYFLIAAEIAGFCREQGIFFHLRGSGVSSFLLHLLGISRVNPLGVRGLLFERFVNRLRDDLPDIDIDIDSSRRAEVFRWLFARYRDRVAFVSAHKFFGARSALYETARGAGLNPEDAHALTRDLPLFASPADLKPEGKGRLSAVYAAAARLEGVFKELSLHVGGVVFSEKAVDAVFPMESSPQGFRQVVWDKDAVERLKIFKLDLLGVRGFEVIAPLALNGRIEYNDRSVWEMIGRARTVGCFQIESPLSRENLRRAKPESLAELAIALAIIRPGPAKAGMKKAYQERQPPLHPLLGKLFPQTRGAIIFEEQIAELLDHLTGWGLERAEKVRKELKKRKDETRLQKEREEFFGRGRLRGWSDPDLTLFWKLALDFSLYAFCQAHSVAYSYSAYLSAWLKAKLPAVFFCRLFNAAGGYYPLPVYIEEAKKNNLRILAPDVNLSGARFVEENGAVRAGLMFVKGVGEKLSSRILEARNGGYATLEEFLLRTRANERELSALLSVSAFRSLGRDGFTPEEKEKNWRETLGFLPDAGP